MNVMFDDTTKRNLCMLILKEDQYKNYCDHNIYLDDDSYLKLMSDIDFYRYLICEHFINLYKKEIKIQTKLF